MDVELGKREKREMRRIMLLNNETTSLERSLQNCSLTNNNNNNTSSSSSPSLGVVTSSLSSSSSSSDENYIDLNSHVSLPYHWDQCLDLKTGEVYYVNWSTGKKMKEDPRTTRTGYNGDYYSEDEDDDDSEAESESDLEIRGSDLESHESSSCSSSIKPRSRVLRQEKEELREEEVLVVAGCQSCFMYYMLPKQLHQCPKCCATLLHFPPDTRSFPYTDGQVRKALKVQASPNGIFYFFTLNLGLKPTKPGPRSVPDWALGGCPACPGPGPALLGTWLHTRVVDPFLLILRRGIEPKQLAFSSALGFTLGVFPICGVTLFLCGLAIPLLGARCHAPTMVLSNFVATPIELSLIVPFLRLGETISGSDHFPLTSDALKKVLTGQASTELLLSIANALLGWLVAAPFILSLLYILLLPCFKVLVRKFKPATSSPSYASSDVRLKHFIREENQGQRANRDSDEVAELLTPLRSSQTD